MKGETFSIGHSIIVIQYILFISLGRKTVYTDSTDDIRVCNSWKCGTKLFITKLTKQRLFSQLCDKHTHPATLEEVSDVTFKEKLLKVCPTIQCTLIRLIYQQIKPASQYLSVIYSYCILC